MKRKLFIISCLLLIAFSYSLEAQTNTSLYKVANKFTIGGDGGWDYLSIDQVTGRIFVSHGIVVNVVNEKDGKLMGTIPDTKGVHGIAISNDLNKAFISNGRDSSVTIIDLNTLAFIKKVQVTGQNPDAILYDPFSHKVFAFNGRSSSATVIDAMEGKVVATIKLDGKPEFSVSDGKGKVYVNIEDKSEISCINSATLKVEHVWSIAPGEEPSGLAIDKDNQRLFAVTDNKLMVVVDAVSGKVLTTLPIGERTDGVAFDPGLKRVYSSNGIGSLTVVQEVNANEFKVLENVTTQPGARTITIDNQTHHVFLPTAEFLPAKDKNSRPQVKPGSFMLLDIMPLK